MKVLIVGTVGACEHCRAYFEIQGEDVKKKMVSRYQPRASLSAFSVLVIHTHPGSCLFEPRGKIFGPFFWEAPTKEMPREGDAGRPGGPVPGRRWMEMSASISSTGYRVACTVSASYGQGLGEAGQIRGADRGTSAVPGRLSRDPLAGPI